MFVLQCLPVEYLFPALLREGLGVGNPSLKREQLSAGRGQLGLDGDQGRRSGLLALLRFIQP